MMLTFVAYALVVGGGLVAVFAADSAGLYQAAGDYAGERAAAIRFLLGLALFSWGVVIGVGDLLVGLLA